MGLKIYFVILIGLLVAITWIKPASTCHAGHEHDDEDGDDQGDDCLTVEGDGEEEEIVLVLVEEECEERRRRRKRRAAENGSKPPTKNFSKLRRYFKDCMTHVEKEIYDWKTVVDFSILDTIWYDDADKFVCKEKDTINCWQQMVEEYLIEGSPRRTSAKLCIQQYSDDIRYNSGNFNKSAIVLKHHSPNRKKRETHTYYWQMSEAELREEYSKCVQTYTVGTFREDQKISSLVEFVNSDIKCGRCDYNNIVLPQETNVRSKRSASYHVQSSSNIVYVYAESTTPTLPTYTTPDRSNQVLSIINSEYRVQWPFTLQALTKKNATLSRAFERCNRKFDREFKRPPPKLPWAEWGDWTLCKATCSKPSAQFRTRHCQSGAGECPGKSIESKNCFAKDCATWRKWSQWTPCSVTCGVGTQKSTRECSRPGACIGPSERSDVCGNKVCYGSWTSWSSCQPYCGKRYRYSYKFCTQSTLQISCSSLGNRTRIERKKRCASEPCYGRWSDFSECSVSCGDGVTVSRRECLSAEVVPCRSQDLIRESPCYKRPCSGLWSGWSTWSKCSRSCGGLGVRIRERVCKGKGPCKGAKRERIKCKYISCKPAWEEWSAWSSCSLQKKTRKCINGVPGEGLCKGDWEEYRSCNGCTQTTTTIPTTTITTTTTAPLTTTSSRPPTTTPHTATRQMTTPYPTSYEEAGVIWSQWEPWSHCSVTCGVGTVQRKKVALACKGKQPYMCDGTATESRTCSLPACTDEYFVVSHSSACRNLSPSYCQGLPQEACFNLSDRMLCRRTCGDCPLN